MDTDRVKVGVNFLEETDQGELLISQYNGKEELVYVCLGLTVFLPTLHGLLGKATPNETVVFRLLPTPLWTRPRHLTIIV